MWRDIFYYNDGKLFWAVDVGRRIKKGSEAGSVSKSKKSGERVRISIDGERYYRSRIVWEIHNGEIPHGMQVDHIDHNTMNDNISNLRLVRMSVNNKNKSLYRNSKTGITGVNFSRGKWIARANIDGVRHEFYFDSFQDAAEKRIEIEVLNKFHINHGK